MRRNYRSHWGADGLTSYMRYTLAGGLNREVQNVAGPDLPAEDTTEGGSELRQWLTQIQQGLMDGQAHRGNILDPWHRKVNLGIACDPPACWIVQQFESGHVRFSHPPYLDGAMLTLAGNLAEGLELDGVALWYHQPTHPLTLGQLDATFSYGAGQYPAAFCCARRRPRAKRTPTGW